MIWVLGGGGMLGRELARQLGAAGLPWRGSGRECDIRSPDALSGFALALGKRIDWIINCAAYTSVDKAESEPDLAQSVNAIGARNVARLARELGAGLIHLSSDYVFGGSGLCDRDGNRRAWTESDAPCPVNRYGQAKAEGERLALDFCPRAYILRSSWLYGGSGSHFVSTVMRKLHQADEFGVVADQWGCPTWTVDLGQVILSLTKQAGQNPGIYHVSGTGVTSWFHFAEEIRSAGIKLGLLRDPPGILPLSSADYLSAATRPEWSALDCHKLESSFGWRMPEWQVSLQSCLAEWS